MDRYTCISRKQCHIVALERQYPCIKFLSIFPIFFSFLLLLSHFQFLADVNIIDIRFSVLHGKRVIGQAPGSFGCTGTLGASKMHSKIGEAFGLDAGLSADKASDRLATMLQQPCPHPHPSLQGRHLGPELTDSAFGVLLLGSPGRISSSVTSSVFLP